MRMWIKSRKEKILLYFHIIKNILKSLPVCFFALNSFVRYMYNIVGIYEDYQNDTNASGWLSG